MINVTFCVIKLLSIFPEEMKGGVETEKLTNGTPEGLDLDVDAAEDNTGDPLALFH